MEPEPDLTDLFSRITAKEAPALSELHRLTAHRLFAVVLNVLKNRQEAEDALQDVFLKVWTNASRYNPALGSPISWLITVARNSSYDRYRKRTRLAERHQTSQQDLTEMASSHPPQRADDFLLSHERSQKIRTALKSLAPDQRTAIELAFFSGHTQQEVSEKLGVPLGTIKARIRRGMQSLKPHLTSVA